MRYLAFEIVRYRGVREPIRIDVTKRSLIPIIGTNESGKTTILHAIFAFDFYNDQLNGGGRQLEDTFDLNDAFGSEDAEVCAEIELPPDECADALAAALPNGSSPSLTSVSTKSKRTRWPGRVRICRNLRTLTYSCSEIASALGLSESQQDSFGRTVVGQLPYILFFDDFRDSVQDKIPITKPASGKASGWLAIMDRLFRESSGGKLSVFTLDPDPRIRDYQLSTVRAHLRKTISNQWKAFKLDDHEPLEVGIEFVPPRSEDAADLGSLRIRVLEKDPSGAERGFFIHNRSKGFYWFFNFVMKLEFNPKVVSNSEHLAIYLLDEPGSYLHSSAQQRLCRKLRALSEDNVVIYCTHSHRLLDPAVVPIQTVQIANRVPDGSIELIELGDYARGMSRHDAAFEPIMDALELRPFAADVSQGPVLITEGIFDFYFLDLFKPDNGWHIVPATGATTLSPLISYALGWGVQFIAMWDDDSEGRAAYQKALKGFGAEVGSRHFRLLPGSSAKKPSKWELQNLIEGEDLRMLRSELGLPMKASFEKTIAAVYFADEETRQRLLKRISEKTRDRVRCVFDALESAA